jgi:hypothetical protein
MMFRPVTYVRLYFGLVLLLGLVISKDYGVSWDEYVDRIQGMVTAKYIVSKVAPEWTERQLIFGNVPDFATYIENDHGALFQVPLAFMEVAHPSIDSRSYYLVRHYCIFLMFVLGLWSVYRIGLIRFGSWRVGLFASALLLLSPRFFADAFTNGKDLIFVSLFAFAMYTLVRLLQRPTLARAVLHGLATALATDVRILGCMVFALSLGMLALEAGFGSVDKARRRQLGKAALCYCVAAWVLTILFWPYLWDAPLHNFRLAFENMKRFRWDGQVLYLGDLVSSLTLPWHYAPVWIIVTTPVAYLLAFLTGVTTYAYTFLTRPLQSLRSFEARLDLAFAGWFFIPILMVIVLHSVIYDGWRHLYFVYPAFLLLAVRGMQLVWRASRQRVVLHRAASVLALLAGMEGLYTVVRMVSAHPNQQVFFSFLTPGQAERLFERDYWGVSYRQGLEWILAHDSAPELAIDAPNPIVLENNLSVLKPADRARFKITPTAKAGYFLTNYRAHPEPYPESVGREVYALKTNGIKILSVFYHW